MMLYPPTAAFENVTVILPVMNETVSLRQTVDLLMAVSPHDIRELLIMTATATTPESLRTIGELRARYGETIVSVQQSLPFLGGALREAFARARGSHVLLMASDLETDPALVPDLIAVSRQNPNAIGTVTRWKGYGGFVGYNPVKLLANAVFQKLFALLYQTDLSDMTYGYRIFPTKMVQMIVWEELRHPFLFETLVKPLRLGAPVVEIPGKWQARTEGRSQNSFFRNFAYFRVGLRVRFSPLQKLLRA